MVYSSIDIPIYDWKVVIIGVELGLEADSLKEALVKLGVEPTEMDIRHLMEDRNSAITWNVNNGTSVMAFGEHDSDVELINSLNHEKRHVVDDIVEGRTLQGEKESAAYIDGYISKTFYAKVKSRQVKSGMWWTSTQSSPYQPSNGMPLWFENPRYWTPWDVLRHGVLPFFDFGIN